MTESVDALFDRAIERYKAGEGADTLLGGVGRDILWGGAGDDVLIGGGSIDRFVFTEPEFGDDRITDFRPSETIVLTGHATSFAALDLRQAGSHVVITLEDGSIQLDHTNLAMLGADQFEF